MSKYNLYGASVIVTGASSGIGRKLAEKLIKKYGCKVMGVGRSEKKFLAFAESLGELRASLSWRLFDVGDKGEWLAFAEYLKEKSFVPDLLVNCAGILPPFAAYGENSDAEGVFKTNFLSAVYSFEALSPLLKQSRRPKLVNVASSSALCPFAGVAAYSASKAALWRFTECIAQEKGIPAAVLLPGFTDTEVFRSQDFDEGSRALFKKFSMSAERMSDKMLGTIRSGRKRRIIGIDAHLMNFGYKFFPRLTPLLITRLLKRVRPGAFGSITN